MCYSILIETSLKKLQHQFDAKIDTGYFLKLYEKRAEGEKNLNIPRGIDLHFLNHQGDDEKKCAHYIKEFDQALIKETETKITEKTAVIEDLRSQLEAKWYKTKQKKLDSSLRVKVRLEAKLNSLKQPIEHQNPEFCRIMQYYYAPLVLRENHQYIIRPHRYQVRSRYAVSEPERKLNLFNARVETLTERKTWKPLYLHNHAALVYYGFYEWVEDPNTGLAREIYFRQKGGRSLWTPALYEIYQSSREEISSFAVITQPPRAQVAAAGHDRSPILPEVKWIKPWLDTKNLNDAQAQNILNNKAEIDFEHAWVN